MYFTPRNFKNTYILSVLFPLSHQINFKCIKKRLPVGLNDIDTFDRLTFHSKKFREYALP